MEDRAKGFEVLGPEDLTALPPNDVSIIRHYVQFIGRASRFLKFNQLPDAAQPLLVVEFPPPSDEEAWIYATVGASREPMPYPADWTDAQPERRIELMAYLEQRNEELPSLLAGLAAYPFLKHTFLAPGHTMGAPADDGIVTGSPLTAALFTAPYFEERAFRMIQQPDGTFVHMLWVVPIYNSERLYARQHGDRALVQLFHEHETNLPDLWREPVV